VCTSVCSNEEQVKQLVFGSLEYACHRQVWRTIILRNVVLSIFQSKLFLFVCSLQSDPCKHLGPDVNHKRVVSVQYCFHELPFRFDFLRHFPIFLLDHTDDTTSGIFLPVFVFGLSFSDRTLSTNCSPETSTIGITFRKNSDSRLAFTLII